MAQSVNSDSLARAYLQADETEQTRILKNLEESPDQILIVGRQIKRQAQRLGIPDTLSNLDYKIAYAYYNKGYYDSVLQIANPRIDRIRQDADENTKLANMLNVAGIAYYFKGQYGKSLKCFFESLAIWEKEGFTKGQIKANLNIGNTYYFRKEFYRAIEYYEKSLELCLAIRDTTMTIHMYANIGETLNNHFDSLDLAMEYYQNALEWAELQDDEFTAAVPLRGVAEVQIKRGQLDEALSNARHVLKTSQRQQNMHATLYAWRLMALVRGARQEYELAIQAAIKAYDLAVTSQSAVEIGELGKLLANYYSELGNFEKAHQYRSIQVAYQDSVYSVEKSKIVATLEQTQAETKIKVLEKDNALKKARLEQQMIYTVGLSLVAILLLGALILVYISHTQRKKLILQLAEQKEEIETNNEQLMKMNDKLQQQRQQLEDQNQDLSSLNQLKDKLLSIISHDFRSPLNSLKGIIDILDSGGLSPEEIPQLFGSLSTTVENTTNMLDNLLKWTRSQMSGVKVAPEPFALSTIVKEVLSTQTNIAEKKGVTLQQEVSDALSAYADPEMIRLVIRNLISNAIKFTEQDDIITLQAQPQDPQIVVSVSDTGIGIQPEDMEKLFRLNNYTTHGTANEKGTGLGLVLCQEFVEKNGGTIWVESELDRGTTFFFTLITDFEHFSKEIRKKSSDGTDSADNHKTTPIVH
ncbi:MAG: ATP-binding protein [Bacteroidota bacterium]